MQQHQGRERKGLVSVRDEEGEYKGAKYRRHHWCRSNED